MNDLKADWDEYQQRLAIGGDEYTRKLTEILYSRSTGVYVVDTNWPSPIIVTQEQE